MSDPEHPYVGRGGLKLEHALREFGIDPNGFACADLGCSTGGFTDCLLQHGAASVVSVDTAYGELAWKLRNDDRVTVRERTNALHAEPDGPVDLVVLDLSWTPQRLALPAAAKWLKPAGRVISLVKPHYELTDSEKDALPAKGVLDETDAERVVHRVMDDLRGLGFAVTGVTKSPILGGGKRSKSKSRGNAEWLALVQVESAAGGETPAAGGAVIGSDCDAIGAPGRDGLCRGGPGSRGSSSRR